MLLSEVFAGCCCLGGIPLAPTPWKQVVADLQLGLAVHDLGEQATLAHRRTALTKHDRMQAAAIRFITLS